MFVTTATRAVIGKYLERCARGGGDLEFGARISPYIMLTFGRAA